MANSTHTGSGKTVVVIDSGWSPTWEPAASVVYQHDYADNDGDARNPNADTHGALVTSRILSQAPDVGIIALKVTPDGSTTASGSSPMRRTTTSSASTCRWPAAPPRRR